MGFTVADELPKLLWLVIAVAAFLAAVGAVLLIVDRGPRTRREWWQAACFLGPAVVLLLVGLVYPVFRTVALSFMDGPGEAWVGFSNYVWMFTRPEILIVLRNTLLWVLFAPVLATATGLVYAVLVDRSRYEAVAKSLLFMPMAISFVGASIIWKFVYAHRPAGSDQIGLLNAVWTAFGGQPRQWILDAPLNTLLLIVVLVWIQAGFALVIQSAAIKAIPTDIVEAARIDGVSAWQLFWRVTLPMIWPTVTVVLITISVQTLKIFDIVRTMTGGQFGTSVIANEMYSQAFRYGEVGQGSALAVILFVLVVPLVLIQIRKTRRSREAA